MKHEAIFKQWVAHLIEKEGGWSNHPADKGGKTNMGVTLATFQFLAPKMLGIVGSEENLRALTKEQHEKIALWYWNTGGGDAWTEGNIAAFFAEEVWGGGAGTLTFYRNRINLNYKTKFVNHAEVMRYINTQAKDWFFILNEWKKKRYANIVANNPSQSVFQLGWTRRIDAFYEAFKKKVVKKV